MEKSIRFRKLCVWFDSLTQMQKYTLFPYTTPVLTVGFPFFFQYTHTCIHSVYRSCSPFFSLTQHNSRAFIYPYLVHFYNTFYLRAIFFVHWISLYQCDDSEKKNPRKTHTNVYTNEEEKKIL